jgi:propionyl-CoA carboxylase beta chain
MNFLPSNNLDDAPTLPTRDRPDRICESLNTMIPDSPKKPYDMLALFKKLWMKNIS